MHAALRAFLPALALALMACAPSRPGRPLAPLGYTPAGELAEPGPAAPFVHREIPLVVHVLSGAGEENPTNETDVSAAVAFANDVFVDADVGFYVHDVRRLRLRFLHHDDDAAELLRWADVRDDAIAIDPSLAAAAFTDDVRGTRAQWLLQITARQPRDAVHVLVFTFIGHDGVSWGSNCASSFPHNDGDPGYAPPPSPASSRDGSKGIYCTPGALPGRRIHALAHELGHYLGGLVHTHDVMNRGAIATEGATPADYYDLVYAPDAAGTGALTFRSKAGAESANDRLRALDPGCGDCIETDSRKVLYGTSCDLQVRLVLPRGVVLLDTAEDAERLGGVAFARRPGSPRYGVNVMSYLFEDPERTPCDLRLSRAQIGLIQKKLGTKRGHRNLLGVVPRARWEPDLRGARPPPASASQRPGRPATVPTPK